MNLGLGIDKHEQDMRELSRIEGFCRDGEKYEVLDHVVFNLKLSIFGYL